MKARKRFLSIVMAAAMVFGTVGDPVSLTVKAEGAAVSENATDVSVNEAAAAEDNNVSANEAVAVQASEVSGNEVTVEQEADVSADEAVSEQETENPFAPVPEQPEELVGTTDGDPGEVEWHWEPVMDEWQDEYGYDPENMWKGIVSYDVEAYYNGQPYVAEVVKGELKSPRSCTLGPVYTTTATVTIEGKKYTDQQNVEYFTSYGHDLNPVWTLSEDLDNPGLVVTQGDTCARCGQKLNIHYEYNAERIWPLGGEVTCCTGLDEARYEARYVVEGDDEHSYVVLSNLTQIPATGVHSYTRNRSEQPYWIWETMDGEDHKTVWTARAIFDCGNWIPDLNANCNQQRSYSEADKELTITSETKDGMTVYTATLTVDDFYNFNTHKLDQKLTYTATKTVTQNGFEISDIPDQTYTGKPVTIDYLSVWYNGTWLEEGVDYTVKYANNKNAGTASVTVTGKGKYKGSITQNFKINPADIGSDEFSAADQFLIYNKKAQKKASALYWNGKAAPKSNYTVEFTSGANDYKEPGDYSVTIKAKGTNFTGTRTYTIHISDDKKYIPASKVKITINKDYLRMTPYGFDWGKSDETDENGKRLAFSAAYNKKDVTKVFRDSWIDINEETGVGYLNLIADPGTEIDGMNFYGLLSVKFTAKRIDISKEVTVNSATEMTYPGFKIDRWYLADTNMISLQDSNKYFPEDSEPYILRLDEDYTMTLKGNDKSGTMTVTITGKRGYTGKVVRKIKIGKQNLQTLNTARLLEVGMWEYNEEENRDYLALPETIPYSKGGAVPGYLDVGITRADTDEEGNVMYTWTDILTPNKDYTVKYSGNTKVGETATITITGKGNYEGTVTRTFKVGARSLENTEEYYNDLTVLAKDVVMGKTVSKTMKPYLAKVEVYDNISGKKLQEKTDYTLKYYYHTEEGPVAVEASTETANILSANDLGFGMFVEVTAVEGSGYSGICREDYKIVGRLVKASEIKIKPQVLALNQDGNIDEGLYFAHPEDVNVPDEEMGIHEWFNPWEASDEDYKVWQDLYFDKVPEGCRLEIAALKNVSKAGTGSAVVKVIYPEGKGGFTVGGYVTVKFKIVQKDIVKD